jgi:hypothetical protein
MGGVIRRLALAASLTLVSSVAVAQSEGVPSRVRIVPPTCTVGPFDTAAWIALARSELETDGVRAVEVAPDPSGAEDAIAVVRVEVSPCRADATEVTLAIDDLVTRKSVRRSVALDDIAPDARPRALALAVAELLRASWAELALPDAPVAPEAAPALRRAMLVRLRPAVSAVPTEAPARPAAPTPTATPRYAWWAMAGLDLRTFPGQSGVLLGGRAVVTWSPWPSLPLRLRADLGSAYGTAFARRGEVTLVATTAGLGVQLGGGTERFDLSVGPRTELGWARVTGRPASDPSAAVTDDGFVWFVALACTLKVRLGSRWSAALDIATGQTLNFLTVVSDGERVTGIDGPMLAVTLGLGASW